MDPALYEAAEKGNVKFLKKAVDIQPPEYFLAVAEQRWSGTMLHLAAWNDQIEFMEAAMEILPKNILKQLLQTTDTEMFTVLHMAAMSHSFKTVKCIRVMYASFSWDDDEDHVKPWLALNESGNTPFNLALDRHKLDEISVMEIMSMDPQLESCTIGEKNGITPLYYAVYNGFSLVAEKILMSGHPDTSILGSTDFLELLSITSKCSGHLVRMMWKKYGGSLDEDGNTPLHSALNSTSTQALALETLSTYPALRMICNDKGESPFFLAVRSGCEQVVDEIISIEEPRFYMLQRNDGTTILHSLSSCTEKTIRMLLEKFWWVINLRDVQGKTALDYAKQEKALWLINLLTNQSLIQKQEFDWIEAWEREETDAILAFVHNCEDLKRICCEKKDTPLHLAKLATYKNYLDFLKIPSVAEIKNIRNYYGETPLHCALKRQNLDFAKALLCDDGVTRMIRDNVGDTSMDLLAKLCKENKDWEKMCKEIKVNPFLRTTYILPGTNLEQMRTTLSVIAALLATITFAAGFTLPGGLNSDNGQAILGKKAAFFVFLLADAYAMCTSMLVLFCLVWSMVSKPDMARLLVDRSVFILMQSLYATLLVFVTGIYVVIEHTSLWAAIVIFVMCSLIGITANRTILHWVIGMFVPAAYREKLDEMRLLEEGNAGAFTTEEQNRDRRE